MADPAFPRLHVRPPTGWLNDPNGLCRVDGTYHVFFQHNPRSVLHGAIAWGHASSTDLLHWRHHPLALHPRPGGIDAGGCWSGCVTLDGDVPTAVYTAVVDDPTRAVVALARSDRRLERWQQDPDPGVGAPEDPTVEQVRDPWLFTFRGRRYAVQGAGSRSGPPQLLLYDCTDLRSWVPLGCLLHGTDPVAAALAPAQVWECPNLFPLGPVWVLLVSQWTWVAGRDVLAGVRYLLGDLAVDGAGLRFRPVTGGVVDEGPSCYAPQVLVEPERVLLWGWAREVDRSPEQVERAGWAGSLTFPRELFLVDGQLACRPAAELVGLRAERLAHPRRAPLAERAFEVVATAPVRLVLRDGDMTVAEVAATGTAGDPARVLVDGSVVETYAGGRCRTDRAYPGADSRWEIDGDPASLVVYRLGLAGPEGRLP